ncbi:MAG: hypothetical protein U0930_22835 [Pirellulales bacterium]
MSCGLIDVLTTMASTDSNKQLVTQRFEQLSQAQPDDTTVAIASLLWDLKTSSLDTAQLKVRAEKLLSNMQLEPVEPGYKLSMKQRKSAVSVTNLWLVAKQAIEAQGVDADVKSELSDRLAERALEAAKRQITNDYSLPILYEWGKLRVEKGDLAKAESLWDQLLEIVTTQAVSRPANNPGQLGGFGSLRAQPGLVPSPAVVGAAPVGGVPNPAIAVPKDGGNKGKPIAPLTTSQYQVVMQVCKLAAKSGMKQLAAKALGQSLKGGLPVPDLNPGDSSDPFSGRVTRSSSSNSSPESLVSRSLQEAVLVLADMDSQSDQLYEIMKGLVLPSDRPQEVRLYLNPIADSSAKECLGSMLVSITAKAGKLDDLAASVEARSPNQGNLPAKQMLLALIAMEKGDNPAATNALDQLMKVASNSQANMQTAMIAATKAFTQEPLKETAASILKLSTSFSVISTNANDPFSNSDSSQNSPWFKEIALKLQKYYMSKGDEQSAKQIFENRLIERQKFYARYSSNADYANYQQKNDLVVIARDAFELGLREYAFETWGRSCEIDTSNYSRVEAGGALAELAVAWTRTLPAEKRFEIWHQWTMPTDNRKTIRTAFNGSRSRSNSSPELHSNLVELIDAAAIIGKLDQLSEQAAKAKADEIDKAEYLQTLIAIKKDDLETSTKSIDAILAKLKSQTEERNNANRDYNYNRFNRPADISADVVVFQQAMRNPKISTIIKPQFQKIKRQISALDFESVVTMLDLQAFKTWGGLDQAEVTFKHWSTGGTPYQGRRMQLWATESDQIQHILNTQTNSGLFFKYPLQGNFTIALELPEVSQHTASTGFGGFVWDVYSNRLYSPQPRYGLWADGKRHRNPRFESLLITIR